MAKIAKDTVRVAGFRQMVVKGNSYDDNADVVKQYPSLFETPDEAQERQHRPTSTAELGDKAMSSRKVERATQAPDEKRDVDLVCDCGFEAKSPGGLGAHQRSHGDD